MKPVKDIICFNFGFVWITYMMDRDILCMNPAQDTAYGLDQIPRNYKDVIALNLKPFSYLCIFCL